MGNSTYQGYSLKAFILPETGNRVTLERSTPYKSGLLHTRGAKCSPEVRATYSGLLHARGTKRLSRSQRDLERSTKY